MTPDADADADGGVVYVNEIQKKKISARFLELGHQGSERISLGLNVRLKTTCFAKGFVSVKIGLVPA